MPTTTQSPAPVPVVRELRLKRRRTNVPWIYLVYHVDPEESPKRRPVRAPKDSEASHQPENKARRSRQPSWRRRKAGTSSGEGGSSAPPAAPPAQGVVGS